MGREKPRRVGRRAARPSRWTREDWIEHGVGQLKGEGPGALTIERLCESARRTRGSFYHHFDTVERFVAEIAARWRRTETQDIAERVRAVADPRDGLRLLARLSDRVDPGLELGVRALAAAHPAVGAIVGDTDDDREAFLTDLLRRSYGLDGRRAGAAARLFHSLHLAALVRRPDQIAQFSLGPSRALTGWLTGDSGDGKRRTARPRRK